MTGFSRAVLALATFVSASACHASPRMISPRDPGSPLRLERTIALPNVAGRIDHLAIDARDDLRTD